MRSSSASSRNWTTDVRYLVLSDIHGNLEALEAALVAGASRGYDQLLVLGDLVGYCADPNGVIDRLRALRPAALIRGNHDKVASGVDDAEGFNLIARSAIEWTYKALTAENRAFLAALPAGPVAVDALVEICHGTPYDEDAYVFDELDALRALEAASRPVCLFGHTHVPVAFRRSDDGLETYVADRDVEMLPVPFEDESSYLVNPGSVGQPRDGNPRAGFGIVDTATRQVDLVRVAYPVQLTQAKIVRAGLPDVLAKRLAIGR
jgi:diadenosine tetraphosphatase ApaH/serine/threonine PP2A family protein phosphatase